MTQKFVNRICDTNEYGQYLHHGKYSYDIDYDVTGGFWYVSRCPRGREYDMYITPDGTRGSYWTPVQRLKATKNGLVIVND